MSQAEVLACEPPTHLAVPPTPRAVPGCSRAALTPIDSNYTRLRFVHHLDEQTKSKEVAPGLGVLPPTRSSPP